MRTIVIHDQQTYCSLYEQMEKPHLTQSWAWGQAKVATAKWDVVRLAFYEENQLTGLCQILRSRHLGVPIISRVNRGPLFCSGLSDAQKSDILSQLRSRFRFMLNGILLIAPGIPPDEKYIQILRRTGFLRWKVKGWHSSIIDLHRDTDEIRHRFHSPWRTHLNHGEKSGLSLISSSSVESLELMIKKHEDNMREKQFVGPSGDFVRALYKANPEGVVVLLACKDGRPVCGTIMVMHGLSVEYFIGWFSKEGRKLNAGNFLMWNALIEVKRRGCRWLDLGGFGISERYGHFKIGMGGDEYDLAGEWLCF
jgi:hypothetical protein